MENKHGKKILKVEKSWKFESYAFVTLANDPEKPRKRKLYPRKTGALKGKLLFNMDCNVYAIDGWKFETNTPSPWTDEVTWIGNYSSVKEAIEAIESNESDEKPVIVDVPVVEGEVFHDKFAQIKICVENNIPVYLAGPAGSGKNHTLEQVAKQLGLEFYFTNSVQQEYKLTGFIDAGGNFHETEFYKAFKDGGLFFLDEMDASIPEVLVLLNAAIANGYFEFPNGKINAHPNFRVVAAGNTVGSGADENYTGRMVLDQATLDRFVIIDFDYCLKIELALSKNNVELVNFIRDLRDQANEQGIRATFSYRCITMVTKLEKAGMALKDIMDIAVFKGMDKDTRSTFKANGKSNRYYNAMVA